MMNLIKRVDVDWRDGIILIENVGMDRETVRLVKSA